MLDLIVTTKDLLEAETWEDCKKYNIKQKFYKNECGTLLPYFASLDQKWTIDSNFKVPDPIFKIKGSLDGESWGFKNFTPFFFNKQSIFDPWFENSLSFSKKLPPKIV